MLVWYLFQCDDNHSWSLLHDDVGDLPPGSAVCERDGREAVTEARMPLADRVRVTIAPAASVADRVTGKVMGEGRYLLEVAPWNSPEVLRTAESFTWVEAVERAAWFENLTWEQARRRWARAGLGGD